MEESVRTCKSHLSQKYRRFRVFHPLLISCVIFLVLAGDLREVAAQTGSNKTPANLRQQYAMQNRSPSSLINAAFGEKKITLDDWARFQAYALFDDTKLPLQFHGAQNRDMGTPVLLEILKNWNSLSIEARGELRKYHFKEDGTLARPAGLADTSGNSHFLIHYTTNPSDANFVQSVDLNVNGIPDFIDTVLAALDTTWAKEIEEMRYVMPPADSGRGGDWRFDIYIVKLAGMYGLTCPEIFIGNNPNSTDVQEHNAYIGFFLLCNDFSKYKVKGSAAIRSTLAHEFFHLVQFGYNPAEEQWLLEATATWMEEEVFPSLKSGAEYLPGWFGHSDLPLEDTAGTHEYGSWIFFRYLRERAGGPNLIRYIWYMSAKYDLLPGDNSFKAISYVLGSWGDSDHRTFKQTFADFATTNLLKTLAPYDYRDGSTYPDVVCSDVAADISSIGDFVDRHAAKYYKFNPSFTKDSLLAIRFVPGDPVTRFAKQIIIQRGTSVSVRPFDSTITIAGDPTIDRLFLIVANYDTAGTPDGSGGKKNDFGLEIKKTLDLQLFATGPETFIKGSQNVEYKFYYRNNGLDSIRNAILRDSLPAGTAFYGATNGGSHTNGVVTWNLGSIAPTDTFQMVQCTVKFYGECGDITNDAYSIEAGSVSRVYGPAVKTPILGGNCYEIKEIQPVPDMDVTYGFCGSDDFPHMNNSGQVVGTGYTFGGDYLPFLINQGIMQALPLLPVENLAGHAYDINDAGDIVGTNDVNDDPSTPHTFYSHAVQWHQGSIGDLQSLISTLRMSEADAINNSGWVAIHGTFKDSTKPEIMIYRNGQLVRLDSISRLNHSYWLHAMNDAGQIVGMLYPSSTGSLHQAFVCSDTGLTVFGADWGSTYYSRAYGINNAGHIVGWRGSSSAYKSAFMWKQGVATDVGYGSYSRAIGINDSDQVVGSGWSNSNDEFATLYDRGAKINLNNVIPNGTGWSLIWASDINNKGQIVGFGKRYGKLRIFILSKPEQPPIVDVEVSKVIPSTFVLSQNYPNPFNPTTTIKYSVPVASKIDVKVYNILGQEIAVLVNEWKPAGIYAVDFNAKRFATGVYFYRLHSGNFFQTKKLLLLK